MLREQQEPPCNTSEEPSQPTSNDSVAAGPVLGFALIFTGLDLVWINLLGSIVFALFIPYVAVGQTLLYFDLQVRGEEEPARPRRRASRFWRASPAPSS
jgi:hypothetical protein